jgi:hypothetical protein
MKSFGWRESQRRRGPDSLDAQAAIGNDVLQRLVRIILRHRAVFVVVMLFFLPVQQSVRGLFHRAKGCGLARDGNDLPKRRDDEKNEDQSTTHRSSLVEGVRSSLSARRWRRSCGPGAQ